MRGWGGEKQKKMSRPHFQHVVLDGSDDDEDKEPAERNFAENSFGVPVDPLHHCIMNGRVEKFVLSQNKLESYKKEILLQN